jgi:predicted ATPase
MSTQSPGEVRADFGPLSIDVQRRQLMVDGTPVEIGGRSFDIAALLVEAAGAIVTKDEIMRRVWRGTIVEENSIQVAVSALRKALGAHGGVVKTVSGRGYRLIASLTPKIRTNLPAATSELIGRQAVLEELARLLSGNRIVTLTGAGGMGKTCLGVETARRQFPHFPDGVWIAELSSLRDPGAVPHAIASALQLEIPDSLAQPSRIASLMGARKLLLVIDNCEHVVDAVAGLVFTLVRANPNLHVIATSREPLRTEGEVLYRVPPLAVPPEGMTDPAALLGYGAVQLFIARARAIESDLPLDAASLSAIVSICRRLDGIPLAIEIAAARSMTLGVVDLSKNLDDLFRLLTSGFRTALPRHRTLSATLDWSYSLLNEAERIGLCRISVPVGRFTLKMAAALMSDGGEPTSKMVETLSGLIAKSLLVPEPSRGEMRYRLLETTRSYALAKLKESGDFDCVARNHAQYCKSALECAELDWQGHARPDSLESLNAMDNLAGNVELAIDWAFSAQGDATLGLPLTLAAMPLWMHQSMVMEARRWVTRALDVFKAASIQDRQMEMRLLTAHGTALLSAMAANSDARRSFDAALQLAEVLQDKDYQLRAAWGLCSTCVNDGDVFEARALAMRLHGLAAASADPSATHSADLLVAGVLKLMGENGAARQCIEAMLNRGGLVSDRPSSSRFIFNRRALALGLLGAILWHQGHVDQSTRRLEQSVEEATAKDHILSLCNTLGNWVCVHMFFRGAFAEAERYRSILCEHASRYGLDVWLLWARCFKGALMVRQGDPQRGLRLLRQTFAELGESVLHPRYARLRWMFADALVTAGEPEEAAPIVDSVLELSKRKGHLYIVPELLQLKAEIVSQRGGADARTDADGLLRNAITEAQRQGSRSVELRATTALARLWRGRGQQTEALGLLAEIYGRFTEGFDTADLREAKQILELGLR